jgi:hypothetical protein
MCMSCIMRRIRYVVRADRRDRSRLLPNAAASALVFSQPQTYHIIPHIHITGLQPSSTERPTSQCRGISPPNLKYPDNPPPSTTPGTAPAEYPCPAHSCCPYSSHCSRSTRRLSRAQHRYSRSAYYIPQDNRPRALAEQNESNRIERGVGDDDLDWGFRGRWGDGRGAYFKLSK